MSKYDKKLDKIVVDAKDIVWLLKNNEQFMKCFEEALDEHNKKEAQNERRNL